MRTDIVLRPDGDAAHLAILARRAAAAPNGSTLTVTGAGGRFGPPDGGTAWNALRGAVARHGGLSVALIDGPVEGGALDLALDCDLRIAGPRAVAALPPGLERSRLARLRALLPPGRAAEVVLRGASWSAEEACEMGLWDDVVPSGRLRAEADVLADWASDVGARQVIAAKAMLAG
ncbi:MAG: enoyl-CoA hydratase/isomerase family protein [Hasllibacter sp.]